MMLQRRAGVASGVRRSFGIRHRPVTITKVTSEAIDCMLDASTISFQYLMLYTQLLCHGTTACIDHLVVPSASEQLNIVTNYELAEASVGDMHGLESVVFRLLLNHQNDITSALIDKIKELDSIDAAIRKIVDFSTLLHEANNADVIRANSS